MSKITKPNFTDVWSSAGSKTTPSSLKIQTGWVGEKPPYEYWNWAMNRNDVGAAYSFQMGVAEWDSTVEYQYSASYKSYVQRNGLVYKALQVGTNKDPATQPTYWALAFDEYGVAATVQSNLTAHISNYNAQALRLIANGIDANLNVTNHLPNINVDTFLIPEGYFDNSTLGDKPFSFGLCKTWKEDSTVVYQFAQSSTNGDFATRLYRNSLGYWTDWKYYANISGSSTQLFSAANGTTGNEVVNKSQLDTKADVAGNAAQEFAVATATTGNSAINKTQFDAKTGQATETTAGIAEICTDAELLAGTSNTVVATPLKLRLGFAASFATDGYISFPTWLGGLIIQWGYNSDIVTVEKPISFPFPFPTVCYNVQCTGDETNPLGAEIITTKSVTRYGFTWVGAIGSAAGVSPEAQKGYWMAIGK